MIKHAAGRVHKTGALPQISIVQPCIETEPVDGWKTFEAIDFVSVVYQGPRRFISTDDDGRLVVDIPAITAYRKDRGINS